MIHIFSIPILTRRMHKDIITLMQQRTNLLASLCQLLLNAQTAKIVANSRPG